MIKISHCITGEYLHATVEDAEECGGQDEKY
jgi:hypothetical protein